MNQSKWMSKAKALAATTMLMCGAFAASTAAQADTYNFSFRLPNDGTIFNGTFQATIGNIGSGSYNFNQFQIFSANRPFTTTLFAVGSGSITNSIGTASFGLLGADIFSFGQNLYSYNYSTTGAVNGNNSSFSFGNDYSGVFSAYNTSTQSGGGGGSGGAPTPEVNAGLGVLIAGASFAFIRRKRGTRHKAMAA